MEKPSFKSSPWIRGAPHRVFSRDIRRTRWRISLDTGGRPGFRRRDFHVQKSLNPLRCQPMTVSGLTITRAWRQPGHRQDRMTQKTLSAFRSDGRGLFRFRTATCCRRARISVWSAARSAKISMILCMPERVSGGDAKFQGFCDRWNKWEGQVIAASETKCRGYESEVDTQLYRYPRQALWERSPERRSRDNAACHPTSALAAFGYMIFGKSRIGSLPSQSFAASAIWSNKRRFGPPTSDNSMTVPG